MAATMPSTTTVVKPCYMVEAHMNELDENIASARLCFSRINKICNDPKQQLKRAEQLQQQIADQGLKQLESLSRLIARVRDDGLRIQYEKLHAKKEQTIRSLNQDLDFLLHTLEERTRNAEPMVIGSTELPPSQTDVRLSVDEASSMTLSPPSAPKACEFPVCQRIDDGRGEASGASQQHLPPLTVPCRVQPVIQPAVVAPSSQPTMLNFSPDVRFIVQTDAEPTLDGAPSVGQSPRKCLVTYKRGDVKLLDQTLDLQDETNACLDRIVSLNEETIKIGICTATKLREQTERIIEISKETGELGTETRRATAELGKFMRKIQQDRFFMWTIILVIILVVLALLAYVGFRVVKALWADIMA